MCCQLRHPRDGDVECRALCQIRPTFAVEVPVERLTTLPPAFRSALRDNFTRVPGCP